MNDGAIRNSYTAGIVEGAGIVGGLVGTNSLSIASSFSIGAVYNERTRVGGLVGLNDGINFG